MGRPSKNNLDFFAHEVTMRNDKKIKAVRAKFGLEGYAVYCMLLEAVSEENCLQIKYNDFSIDVLAGDFGINPDRLKTIIEYFTNSNLNLFQIKNNFIRCNQLEARHEHVFQKRGLTIDSIRCQISAPETMVSATETPVSAPEIPHSIVENSIEKNNSNMSDFEQDLKTDAPYSNSFLLFWDAYPKKQGKGNAWKSWSKIKYSTETLELILKALKIQTVSEQWTKENGQFIPMPATYLNGRRWEDEIKTVKKLDYYEALKQGLDLI